MWVTGPSGPLDIPAAVPSSSDSSAAYKGKGAKGGEEGGWGRGVGKGGGEGGWGRGVGKGGGEGG